MTLKKKNVKRMEIKRTIIIGDVHGCLKEFEDLLDKLSYNSQTDRVILLGDLIDRGPLSVEMVQKARSMNLECLMGNHEYRFLRWYHSNKQVFDSIEFYQHFTDEDVNYIANMPTYIKIDNFIAVHAGLKPNISIENQKKDDLLYLRYTDLNGNFISLSKVQKLGIEAAGAHFWTEFWKGPESVVYGHNVHSFTDPLIQEITPGVMCYGLDTGCCFGGNLTALILESKQIVQVPARRTYYQSRMDL